MQLVLAHQAWHYLRRFMMRFSALPIRNHLLSNCSLIALVA